MDGPPGPIIVATRNDALQSVVDATPPSRRQGVDRTALSKTPSIPRTDLVFIQNGMLQPWLDARGLGTATQVLVFFAVAAKGDAPIDGRTDVNPEGLTAAHGPHAAAFAARLARAGLSCKVLDRAAFDRAMLEKLMSICAYMLVGARHGGITVGDVAETHAQEVSYTLLSRMHSYCQCHARMQENSC